MSLETKNIVNAHEVNDKKNSSKRIKLTINTACIK